MAYRRRIDAAVASLSAFALGIGFGAAAYRGLWATMLVVGLLGAVAVGRSAWLWSEPREVALLGMEPADRRSSESHRRWLAHVLDLVPTALVSRSSDGRMVALNKSARALFATDGPIVEAAADLVQIAAGPIVAEAIPLSLGAPFPRAYAAFRADIIHDGDRASLIALADIEDQLQARETATLKDTLDVLSHEIMNSLTPVTSLAQSAQELLADGDTAGADGALAVLERRASGLLRFVESYRALARLPEPKMRHTEISTLSADVRRLFDGHDQRRGILFEFSEAPRVAVQGDADLLVQALINLLLNAAYAAQSRVSSDGPGRVNLSVTLDGDAVRFEVSDNGLGLGALDPATVIKPFFTTRPGGAGIGLSLVSQIVVAHDSRLEFGKSNFASTGLSVGFSLKRVRAGSDFDKTAP